MKAYLDLVDRILTEGKHRKSGTQGIGNLVYPLGERWVFWPSREFPLITTRRMSWRVVVGELLWFLSGSSRIADLHDSNIHIWDEWATKEWCDKYGLPEGDLGPIYGPQWVRWRTRDGETINQIARLVEEIKNFPDSKRMMVTAWNPEDVDSVMVAPCHGVPWKCVAADGELHLHMFQRSADLLVGVPVNIASYSLLLLMLAQVTGLRPGAFVHHLSDVHIYDNQVEAALKLLRRKPHPLPRVELNPEVKDIFGFSLDDIKLENYEADPYFSIPVAI
jgi:thymidylate synthase